jgi:hypothetical protein
MLDLVIIDNYLNIFDLINLSITNNYNNKLIKENFERLITDYYEKNIKERIGIKLDRKYSKKERRCEICNNESETFCYIDPFTKRRTCFKCKTRTITKTEVYKKYKIYDEDLCKLDYLYFQCGLYDTYGTFYPKIEVIILFYIKYKILNPDKLKRARQKKDKNGLTMKEVRYNKLIEICNELGELEHIKEIMREEYIGMYLKTGRFGIKKMRMLVEALKITREYNIVLKKNDIK